MVATMADVARLAGVSVSTVSYALTGARPISLATRERIERAMLELGYTPNAFARGLKSKRSKIIALLFPRQSSDLGLGALEYILGASDHAQERGYHLLLWISEADALGDLARLARQGLVDGVLIMEVSLRDARIEVVRDAGLTFSMIGRTADPTGLDYADTDFDQCSRIAVDYLVGQGHRHLGFVNVARRDSDSERGHEVRARDGVLRAAGQAGAELTVLGCGSSAVGGHNAFRELISRDPDLTAVIAFNEPAAPGIMAAAQAIGWRVPEEFSLVSISMPEQSALMTSPPITTVSASASAMGRSAADFLIRRVEGVPAAANQVLFDGELVLRGSSGPVAASRLAASSLGKRSPS